MSVDCRITIPPAARVRDVATVLARLTGTPIRLYEHPVLAAHVDSITFEPLDGTPECVKIKWIDGENQSRGELYHFEWSDDPGCHGILLQSTAEALAIAKGLVDFFSGAVDFADNDEVDCNYRQEPRLDIHATDADERQNFHRRLAAVQPLTADDIEAMEPFAEYEHPHKSGVPNNRRTER